MKEYLVNISKNTKVTDINEGTHTNCICFRYVRIDAQKNQKLGCHNSCQLLYITRLFICIIVYSFTQF